MNEHLNFVKSIYNINPDFKIINVENKVAYKESVKYFGQSFEAVIDSIGEETIHFDLDAYNEDIVIALIIKLNN